MSQCMPQRTPRQTIMFQRLGYDADYTLQILLQSQCMQVVPMAKHHVVALKASMHSKQVTHLFVLHGVNKVSVTYLQANDLKTLFFLISFVLVAETLTIYQRSLPSLIQTETHDQTTSRSQAYVLKDLHTGAMQLATDRPIAFPGTNNVFTSNRIADNSYDCDIPRCYELQLHRILRSMAH